jgi:hypothetical protein
MKKLIAVSALTFAIFVFLASELCRAGTITGFIQTPTGGPVANGALTFNLSQGAVLPGTSTLVTNQVSCYTTSVGSIVGMPDPLVAPVVAPNTSSGTLPAGTYYVKIYYFNVTSYSNSSPETTVVLSSTGQLQVSAPAFQPPSASGYVVAISTTSGAEQAQGNVVGWANFTQSAPLTSGAPAPNGNGSSCSLIFSDQLIPTGTFYNVNLLDSNGYQIAGFPQTWCTYGGALGVINVSNGAPVGNCGTAGVYYPTPLYSSPPSGQVSQSVGTALNLGNNSITANQGTFTTISWLNAVSGASLTNPTITGGIWNVSGTGCTTTLELLNTDATPTNPAKFLRINRTTGSLEFMSNSCTLLASMDETGTISQIAGLSGGSGGTGFSAVPFTLTSVGLVGPGGGPYNGNSIKLATPSGSSGGSATGGAIVFGAGNNCVGGVCNFTGPFAFGPINSNTYFGSYNGLNTTGQGLAPQIARVDLTGQTAAIGTTTLYAVPTYNYPNAPTQEYRLSWNAKVTTAAGTSSTLGALTIVYTDPDGVAITITAPASISAGTIATTSTGNTTSTVLLGLPLTLNCKAGTNITYAMAYASNAANAMNYNLHITLEAL